MKKYKICNKCNEKKPLQEFLKRKSADSHYHYCSKCHNIESKQYYLIHKNDPGFKNRKKENRKRAELKQDQVALRSKKCKAVIKFTQNCVNEWHAYFQAIYGNVTCPICDKSLEWKMKKGHAYVCWDHKFEDLGSNPLVPTGPSNWLRMHACNEKNQKIWQSFRFGILCNRCNSFLPTLNRKIFLRKIIEYVYEKRFYVI